MVIYNGFTNRMSKSEWVVLIAGRIGYLADIITWYQSIEYPCAISIL
jgi:hypothetical protein